MRRLRPLLLTTAAVAVAAGAAALALPSPRAEAAAPRVLVLGFDGADAGLCERFEAEQKLPNLAALRARGGYAPLATTNPAQSPVAWASISTGQNPGEHGIFDFLKRVLHASDAVPQITIGLVSPVRRVVLTKLQRAAVVALVGAGGALAGGLVGWFVLGARNPVWRRGGRLQAAALAPAALGACGALVVLSWIPERVPYPRNERSGEPFWVTLDHGGRACEAIEAPLAFPPDEMEHGACLSGLGVPDLQGTWGSWAIWTDDPRVPGSTETGGVGWFVLRGTTEFDVVLPGPLDPLLDPARGSEITRSADEEKYTRELALDWQKPQRRLSETREALRRAELRLSARVHVVLQPGAGATVTTAEGVTRQLAPGVWSEPVPVVVPLSPLAYVSERGRLAGRVRFLLTFDDARGDITDPGGSFRLMVAPLQLDPTVATPPNFPLSSPPSYARELAAAAGPYETLGWPELTNPVKDDALDDRLFLDHVRLLLAQREKRLYARIDAGGWDCLFAMFPETDRVQHALWRHTDPQSPRYDPVLSPQLAGEIEAIYREMDRIVGEAVRRAGPDTRVLVVSDHGFASFRRGVNLNNFLRAHSYQVGTGANVGPLKVGDLVGGRFFADVDWSRSQAYAMGLGQIFLNLKGREGGGIVEPSEARALLARIRADLLELRDADGTRVVREVYYGSDLYRGARVLEAPDLVVGFERGYRVSWQTALGGTDADVITDNTQRWSGDHCSVDPSLVPGILYSSEPLAEGVAPSVLDVAPTVLHLLGVERADLEGRPVTAR